MGKTNIKLGIVINSSISDYEHEFLEGVIKFCKEKNITPLIFPIGELNSTYLPFDYQQLSITSLINKNNVDGILIASAILGNQISKNEFCEYITKNFSIPKISIGQAFPEIPSITANQKNGLKLLIEDLIINHNCKKFAVMGVKGNSEDAIIRQKIIQNVLNKHNIILDKNKIMFGQFTYDAAFNAISEYMNDKSEFDFDALICLNDDMAFACIDFCKKNSINIPNDIKIIGFDDVSLANKDTPRLTTVNQMIKNQSYEGCKLLLKLIDGKKIPKNTKIDSEPRFRQSCGCVNKNNSTIDYIIKNDTTVKLHSDNNIINTPEWLTASSQFYKLHFFQSSIQVKLGINQIAKIFKERITEFDVSAGALVIYKKPISMKKKFTNFVLPNEANLVSSFDLDNNYTQEQSLIKFNPNECILPNQILSKAKGMLLVYPLYEFDLQFGYIIFSPGMMEKIIYKMMVSGFSHLIAISYEKQKAAQRTKKLAKKNKSLDTISTTDELTGLLNRRGFIKLSQEKINSIVKENGNGIIIFGDMDGLKNINDTYGHAAGDIAIKAEGDILKSSFRKTDYVARLGGDEFAILAPNLSINQFNNIKNNIEKSCDVWNNSSKYKFNISISLGYAEFNSNKKNIKDILNEADIILYKEKQRKKAINNS